MSDKPTVGRIVQILHPHSNPKARYEPTEPGVSREVDGAMWCAAIVTFADDTDTIRAEVFLPRGGSIGVEATEGAELGNWRWPPRA